jgi:hypothetical protein
LRLATGQLQLASWQDALDAIARCNRFLANPHDAPKSSIAVLVEKQAASFHGDNTRSKSRRGRQIRV